MIRVKTIAMLDGSIRTTELGTLEAIDLCERTARTSGRAAQNLSAWSVLASANIDAIETYRLTQSDDETIAQDARENLECLMYETSEAMYDIGYLAYWDESTFRIERIED